MCSSSGQPTLISLTAFVTWVLEPKSPARQTLLMAQSTKQIRDRRASIITWRLFQQLMRKLMVQLWQPTSFLSHNTKRLVVFALTAHKDHIIVVILWYNISILCSYSFLCAFFNAFIYIVWHIGAKIVTNGLCPWSERSSTSIFLVFLPVHN